MLLIIFLVELKSTIQFEKTGVFINSLYDVKYVPE